MENSKSKKLQISAICLLVLALAFAVIFKLATSHSTQSFQAMNTYITLKVTGFGSDKKAEEIKNFVEGYSNFKISRQSQVSEITLLNTNHKGSFSGNNAKYFETLLQVSKDSEGAFDISLGALSDLWGIGTDHAKVPEAEEIETVLSACGMDKVNYDGEIITTADGVVLDLGAAGKGMALDEIRTEYLEPSKISKAVISLGGSILLYGKGDFTIGISNPTGESGYFAVLTLPAGCVSTSGNYERYFEQDGVRYHHILDPKTGYPVQNGLVSVTIVSQSGTLSDALSTACFVLGEQKGMDLAEKYGCNAVFVNDKGEVTVSESLKDSLEITDNNYTLR